MEFNWNDYEKVKGDRIHMAGESLEMAVFIYARVLEKYVEVFGFDLSDCAIETDPNDEYRIILGEAIELHCYNNSQNHEAYAAVQYSQMDGSVDIEFR